MKILLISTVTLMWIGFTVNCSAQSRDGSIEDSWSAPSKEKMPAPQQGPPFLQGEKQYRAWDQRPQEGARTWTQQKKQPAPSLPRDMYSSNTQLIDSLSVLYCLSSNYLSTLRNRNEATRGHTAPAPQQPRDFAYQQRAQEPTPLPGRESPEALHKELLQLLEQCLYGRY